ncbi:hypothetical protein PanWU01x14_316640 [Parasponia andersonii]|uniref:Uncharacterized protein n=1 Tax=Parasponia andersonii TaxID=3476 RepID=A0A2P5AMY3_PARAD|nr:hypothetical protein PanWU01x14_316640 [Parasponia andersonii]
MYTMMQRHEVNSAPDSSHQRINHEKSYTLHMIFNFQWVQMFCREITEDQAFKGSKTPQN